MNKRDVHQRFVEQLENELAAITVAAKKTYATATDKEHSAEHKYDTFSLESSYLARGQAKRVEALTDAVENLRVLSLSEFDAEAPVGVSALVRLRADTGDDRLLFLCPMGGGESFETDGETITIITPESPIGNLLLGKTAGQTIELDLGRERQRLTLITVA